MHRAFYFAPFYRFFDHNLFILTIVIIRIF